MGLPISKKAVADSQMCVMLMQSMLFCFANTFYTEFWFLLRRAYEGKAYCDTTLVLITILIAIKLCDSMDMRFFIMLFGICWQGCLFLHRRFLFCRWREGVSYWFMR